MEDGKIVFFPEVKNPHLAKREIAADGDKTWIIKVIKLINSSIELELRGIKKQVSLNNINLKVSDLGNGRTAKISGDTSLFIRDFGLDSFVEDKEYKNALFSKIQFSSFSVNLGNDSKVKNINLLGDLLKSSLFVGEYKVKADNLVLSLDIEHAKTWSLKEFTFLGENKFRNQ